MMEEASLNTVKNISDNTQSPLSLRYTLRGYEGDIHSIAWSPDGRILASGSGDNTIRLWDGKTGQLISTLTGHTNSIWSVAWSPDGRFLAAGGEGDNNIHLWDGLTGQLLSTLTGHTESVTALAWSPDGRILISGSHDKTVRLWNEKTKQPLSTLLESPDMVVHVAWSPDGRILASGSTDATIRLWDGATGQLLSTLTGHTDVIYSVAWSPDGRILASGSKDNTIRLWDGATGQHQIILEGHTDTVICVSFSYDSRFLASKSEDGTVRIWSTLNWETVEIIDESFSLDARAAVFHPLAPVLATLGEKSRVIRIWDIDFDALAKAPVVNPAVHYTTAKIALVGESGVGKSGLGYRIADGKFQVTESTHGQHFWVVETLGTTRADGTQCEAVLWDFAGQSDFRPIHALFLDDIDLALLLFDPSKPDTLVGVDYWLKQLAHKQQLCNTVLVAARTDVSKVMLTPAELEAFCRERGISGGFVATSAKSNIGIDELVERIQQQIDWNARPTTITTRTFKRVKDFVLSLKADAERKKVLVSTEELRELLEQTDPNWQFRDTELIGSIGHLQNHGYVTILRRTDEVQSILLAPDVLINLASRYMLRAGANEKGLGSLDEARALRNEYKFEEVANLSEEERDTLLNAVAELFLSRNICFRESIDNQTFLIFPSLILDRPPKLVEDVELVEDMAYIVTGQIENVYAALVVLLGYSPSFQRVNQWRKQAQYETTRGDICGFKLVNDDPTELELVLYYGKETPDYVRARFLGLFEEILHSRRVNIKKYAPVICPKCGTQQERSTVIRYIEKSATSMYCVEDGRKLTLPKQSARTTLSRENRTIVNRDKVLVSMRTSYETSLSSVKKYLYEKSRSAAPTCFISYAWEDDSRKHWIARLADDLRKADLNVVLDQWHNAAIGASIARFMEQIDKCDFVLVVGTPAYLLKHENLVSPYGSKVAGEMDLINQRLLATELQKAKILPLLLDGEEATSLPPLLRGRVYADFRREEDYLATLFDLVLTLYTIPFEDPLVRDLREKLHDEGKRLKSGKTR